MLPDFRVRQRDYLLEIARALTEELELTPLLDRILGIAIEMLAGRAGLIALHGDPSWHVAASKNLTPQYHRHIEKLIAHISEGEESALVEIQEIMDALQRLTLTASMGLLNGVGLPLMAHKKVIGVIFIIQELCQYFFQ